MGRTVAKSRQWGTRGHCEGRRGRPFIATEGERGVEANCQTPRCRFRRRRVGMCSDAGEKVREAPRRMPTALPAGWKDGGWVLLSFV